MNHNASQSYMRNTVNTASAEQLHLMLLDGAIRFASQGREALERKDFEAMFNALDRAQQIALELGNGLNRDSNPELVDQFRDLYQFIYRRFVDANMQRAAEPIDDAIRILRHQRETWLILAEKVRQAQAEGTTPPTAGTDPQNGPSSFVAEG